jgi:hypothetical protein
MDMETAVQIVEVFRRKSNEAFDEIVEMLREDRLTIDVGPISEEVDGTDPAGRASGYDEPWSLGNTSLSGFWDFVRTEDGVTYMWPDKNVDHYSKFVIYNGTGDFEGMTMALGYDPNGNVVGFVISGGGSKRGITVFFPAEDFPQTNEKVSMIRGGGERGRSGFGPNDPLPPAYEDYSTDMLRDRVPGKWNVQAVVADAEDYETMLGHTAIQARLRGLA